MQQWYRARCTAHHALPVHPDRGVTRLGDLHGEGVEGLGSCHGADCGCADLLHDFLHGVAHGIAVLLALLVGHALHGADDLGDAVASESCEVEGDGE